MNNQAEIIEEILTELNRARTKFPTWPGDPIHAAAVVAEESGELVQGELYEALLQLHADGYHVPDFTLEEILEELGEEGT